MPFNAFLPVFYVTHWGGSIKTAALLNPKGFRITVSALEHECLIPSTTVLDSPCPGQGAILCGL